MGAATSKVDEILDASETFVQARGYNGFSFRDVAAAVGVKSSSVHYHFPTKADLGATLARRYREQFLEKLGDAGDFESDREAAIRRYVGVFRNALIHDGRMCLCGMLGAEIQSLPPTVAAEVKRMFEESVDWLAHALGGPDEDGRTTALRVTATVEGAMILSRTFGDPDVFDRIMDDDVPPAV